MTSNSLKFRAMKGIAWSSVERIANQVVSFIISIVLARLLAPSDYGVVGMLSVFLAISQLFIDAGFSSALIQKKNKTDVDYSTVFWCNLAVSTLSYGILWAFSSRIADFYHMPSLCGMMKVLGGTLVINALFTVHTTRLTALLDFKSQAKVSFSSCIIGGAAGIFLAWRGLGAWALVWQSVVLSVYKCVCFWFISGWRPLVQFSKESFKGLFGFGSRIMLANILSTIYSNVTPLIIGRKYTADALGLYSRADGLVSMPGGIFQSTIGRVIYPVLAEIQDDDMRLRAAYNKYLRIVTAIVVPVMLIVAAVSNPLIVTLIGEKWLPCVPFVMILALDWMVDPIIKVNLNMIYVKGRSDIVLKLEIVKKIIAFTIILISIQFGVIWLCVGRVVYGFIALWLNMWACMPFIKMTPLQQIRDVFIVYVVGFASAVASFGCSCLCQSVLGLTGAWHLDFVRLILSGTSGLTIYLVFAVMLKFDAVEEAKRLALQIKNRLRK